MGGAAGRERQPAGRSINKRLFLLSGLMALAALSPVLFNEFINLDDPAYIVQNPVLRSLSFLNVAELFTRGFVGNYQPLTMLAYAGIYTACGASPAAYHAASLVLHLLNVLLVYLCVFALTRRNPVAFLAAALFGVHPLHVESVAWASALKDLLYTLFFLLSLLLYLRDSVRGRAVWYGLALVCFVCSLLAKAQAVVLPVALILVECFLKRSLSKRAVARLLPFVALSAVFGVLAVVVQAGSGAVQAFGYYPAWQRVLFACYGLLAYVVKLAVPIRLSLFYPYPEAHGWVYVAPLILGAVGVVLWRAGRKSPPVALGVLFFVATIGPVLQLVPVGDAIIADRYTYLPALGLFFAASVGLDSLLRRRVLVLFCVTLVLLLFAALSFRRAAQWHDSIRIYSASLRHHESPLLHLNRGVAFDGAGDRERAVADFRAVVRMEPRYPNAYRNLGVALQQQGKHQEALQAFSSGLAYQPDDVAMLLGRARAFKNLGRPDEALADANRAVAADPKDAAALFLRAEIHGQRGDLGAALADLDAVIALAPGFAEAHANRGNIYALEGKPERAFEEYDEALRLNPKQGAVYMNRSAAYKSAGKYTEALNDALTARRLGVAVKQAYVDDLTARIGRAGGKIAS